MQLENIIPSEVSQIRSPKIICSPSYAVFRSGANAAMLLDLGHMTRGKHIQEVWWYVVNPKHESARCAHSRRPTAETLKRQRSTWEGDQEPV
jgi:hypothetical protein